jgi:hypothetical protein
VLVKCTVLAALDLRKLHNDIEAVGAVPGGSELRGVVKPLDLIYRHLALLDRCHLFSRHVIGHKLRKVVSPFFASDGRDNLFCPITCLLNRISFLHEYRSLESTVTVSVNSITRPIGELGVQFDPDPGKPAG